MNLVNQVTKYLKDEQAQNTYSTAMILSEGKILFQKDDKIDNLILKAKKIIKQKKPLNKFQIESAKYLLDDLRKTWKMQAPIKMVLL